MTRNRFGRPLGGLATAVAISTVFGMTSADSATAMTYHRRPDATQVCGRNCIKLSSQFLGPGVIMNAEVPGDSGTGGKVGQLVTLAPGGDSPNQDFTDYQFSRGTPETVAEFCAAWPGPQSFRPTSYMCLHDSGSPVYEFSWSPYGNESGLCVGLAKAGVSGEKVTLRNCGDSDTTLWIPDLAHCNPNYCPVLNGGDKSFTHPLVLTVDADGSNPADQLIVEPEQLLTGGVVPGNQNFNAEPNKQQVLSLSARNVSACDISPRSCQTR